jgi:uncharacterized protein YprB with RNaseH-like and TPR domain
MIVEDSYIIAWAAKWIGDPPEKVMYRDQRKATDMENDKEIVKELRDLIDEADMTLTHNGIDFDHPTINGRIALHKLHKPSSYRMIDTLRIAKRRFRLPSYKLSYLTEKFNKRFKKLKHEKFPGFDLWKECLAGNKEAWKEMELYNKHDVLSLEELYVDTMKPWDEETNYFIYQDDVHCRCGSTNFKKNGWHYNQTRKYQRYKCLEEKCGYEWRDVRATRCSRFTSTVTR